MNDWHRITSSDVVFGVGVISAIVATWPSLFPTERPELNRAIAACGLAFTLAALVLGFISSESAAKPRNIDQSAQRSLSQGMAGYDDLIVVMGALPITEESTALMNELQRALSAARVDARVNLQAVELGFQRGGFPVAGVPSGVSIIFVTSNNRGKQFATSLTTNLDALGVMARSIGGFQEQFPGSTQSHSGLANEDRNSKNFEPVWIVVGPKP